MRGRTRTFNADLLHELSDWDPETVHGSGRGASRSSTTRSSVGSGNVTNTDWSEWHDAYERPDSGLADRLDAVRAEINRRLDQTAPDPVRVISACAGDGRDLLGVLAGRSDAGRVSALLVEYDAALVTRARAAADALGARVEVRQADAADSSVYADAAPADLVLLCGIFGNVSDNDVRATIGAAPQLCGPGGRSDLDPAPW